MTHNLLERSASLPVPSWLTVKVTTQTGAAYQVDLDGEHVRVGHQGVHADIVRPSDDVMVYSALGFPDPVVVRRHELVIGSERIPLSEIGASAAGRRRPGGWPGRRVVGLGGARAAAGAGPS